MSPRQTLAAGLFLWVLAALPHGAAAGGLTCSVGEVVIENLKIGQSYSLQTLANLPLTVTNTADRAVRVSIDPLVPDSSELRHGAEPIPGVRWASASPETLELAAGEKKSAALTITIPDDERLFGRKFQVNFWSHTLPVPGEMLAYGLKSRVIFSIDRERELPGVSPSGDLSITLLPDEIRLGQVSLGQRYALDGAGRAPLKVRNTSTRPLTVALQALTAEEAGVTLAKGCGDLVRTAAVRFSPALFTLEPGEERTISGTVTLDKVAGLKGKDLKGVISASVANLPVKTQIYSRISVHVR